jgi:anti-anti-sigma factor
MPRQKGQNVVVQLTPGTRGKMITLERSKSDGITLLRLQGSLTQAEVAQIEQQFLEATSARPGSPPPRTVVDLTNVDLITTPAIAMFLAAVRPAEQAGGRVVFSGARKMINDVLHRCRLDAVFTIVPTVQEAMQKARG